MNKSQRIKVDVEAVTEKYVNIKLEQLNTADYIVSSRCKRPVFRGCNHLSCVALYQGRV